MSHLPTLIADLALILISASIITLLFKWLWGIILLITFSSIAGMGLSMPP